MGVLWLICCCSCQTLERLDLIVMLLYSFLPILQLLFMHSETVGDLRVGKIMDDPSTSESPVSFNSLS